MNPAAVEADLARRDPHIPGLATVLDPDAFVAAVRRAAPHADARGGRILYLRYKPHMLCRARYRLDVSGRDVDLDVRACRPEDLAATLSGRDGENGGATIVDGPLGPGRLVLEEHAVVITVFPNDLKLLTLAHLADPARRHGLLSELLPDQPGLWRSELRPLGYRPERRYVAEVRATRNGHRAVVKAYTRKAYKRGKHNGTAFVSSGPLRLARLLGSSDDHRLLAFEWLPGATLHDLFAVPELKPAVVAETGAALATLHDQRPEGLEVWTRRHEISALANLAAELGFVCPALARQAESLALRIGAELASAPPLQAPLHGDFSAAQVIVTPHGGASNRVAIIDLDWSCRGDPADDLGNLLAQAERQAVDGVWRESRVEAFAASFLGGYRHASGRRLPDRIRLYTAIGVFRRARHPMRTRESDWPRRTEALLERAQAIAFDSGRYRHEPPRFLQ